jgi:hypothetical protein
MSYDINFMDPITDTLIELPEKHFMHGGSYVVGGTTALYFNITSNYAGIYNEHTFWVPQLNGLTAADAIPILDKVISELKNDVSDNYWEATEGNAKDALVKLRTMAYMRPDAIIEVHY